MSSNLIVRELPDVCAEAFDLTEGGVLTTVEARLMVRIRVRKRMLSAPDGSSAAMLPQSGASKMIYRFYDVDRFVRSRMRRLSLQVQTCWGKGGWMDIYLVFRGKCDFYDPTPALRNALYRNNRDGTFTDVTEKARVAGGGSAGSSGWRLRWRWLSRHLCHAIWKKDPLSQ